jgi:hypothetical protein
MSLESRSKAGRKPGSGGSEPRETPRAQNAEPATEEEVYAYYIRVQNYAKTAKKFGLPMSTAFDMVKRVGGDRLASDRIAMRADLAKKAWAKVNRLIGLVREDNLGTEKSSQGFEAARSADALARIAGALDPREQAEEQKPTVIHVHTGVAPPPEIADETTGEPKP